MKHIWVNPDEPRGSLAPLGEMKYSCYYLKEEFIKAIAEELAEMIGVGYQQKSVFVNLIFDCLLRRGVRKLLEEYENAIIEEIADEIQSKFSIETSIVPEYNHVTHAKLNPLFEKIKELIKVKEDE